MQPNDTDVPPDGRRAKGAAIDGRALARAKREQMRLRARRIRRTIAAGGAGLFATAFVGIYVQLASGHDPALAAAAARRAAVTSSTTASASSGEESSSTGEEGPSSAEEGAGPTEASSPSSVTTSQS